MTKLTDVSAVPAGWLQERPGSKSQQLQYKERLQQKVCAFSACSVRVKSIGNPLRRVPVCFGTHDGHCDGFRCDVYIREELRATVELSGDYDIGVKIEGSFKGWVIELFQLNCRSTSYKCSCDFCVPGDCSPGTEAGRCTQTSYALWSQITCCAVCDAASA